MSLKLPPSFVHRSPLAAGIGLSLVMLASPAVASDKLEALMATAVRDNPAAMAEFANERAALQDVEAASYLNYPSFSVQSETSGSRPFAQLNLEQPLWTGGRITGQQQVVQAQSRVQKAQTREVQYRLGLSTAEAWFSRQQALERNRVLQSTLERLEGYRGMMRRRVEAQVSPQIELALLDSRTFSVRIDAVRAAAARKTAEFRLAQLVGRELAANELDDEPLAGSEELATGHAANLERLAHGQDGFAGHPAVQRSEAQVEAAQQQAKVQDSAKSPEVFVRLQRTVGAPSTVTNQSLFLGLRYQPGAGLSAFANSRAAAERATAFQFSVDVRKRELADAHETDRQELIRAWDQVRSLAEAVQTSARIQESYERQFVAGRRSWQDLLNAERERNDNALVLVDAKVTYANALYRMKIRLGLLSWQERAE